MASDVPRSLLVAARQRGFKGRKWAELVLFGQALDAVKGNTPAANFVADHAEGKVPLPLTGANDEPLFPNRDDAEARALALLQAARSRGKK